MDMVWHNNIFVNFNVRKSLTQQTKFPLRYQS